MTAIDYAALVERLRQVDCAWSEDGEMCAEAADAIERLTQPGGEVGPACFTLRAELEYSQYGGECGAFWKSNDDADPDFLPLYSAATVARIIAERDAAHEKYMERLGRNAELELERDALQGQVKMLRYALELTLNAVNLAGWGGDFCAIKATEALAAIEPKEKTE